MSTLTIELLDPEAREVLDDLARAGRITIGDEAKPRESAFGEFQRGMQGVAEECGIHDEEDVARLVAEIRREMRGVVVPNSIPARAAPVRKRLSC